MRLHFAMDSPCPGAPAHQPTLSPLPDPSTDRASTRSKGFSPPDQERPETTSGVSLETHFKSCHSLFLRQMRSLLGFPPQPKQGELGNSPLPQHNHPQPKKVEPAQPNPCLNHPKGRQPASTESRCPPKNRRKQRPALNRGRPSHTRKDGGPAPQVLVCIPWIRKSK